MEIKVNYLDNLRIEAKFDDFSVIADQPIRYKGDGSAPGPFDYFLASSALCAAYFVKVYCNSRDIPTENIRLSQNNIVDPEDRYNQIFQIQVELPESISEKDRKGIVRSIDRCTVKKVVQSGPEFKVEIVDSLENDAQAMLMGQSASGSSTYILGKDLPLEQTIADMTCLLADLGMKIEISSWRNIVPNVWSLHIRDAASPMCFTNGKGATKESALCSALGEFIERLNCNFFYNDQFFGVDIANSDFVHYPNEKWFLSNGMSAGNNLPEAQVQCLSEIFERAVKKQIIAQEIVLPDVPKEVIAKYPSILAGIEGLEAQGFPIVVKDASLGGQFPVMCVTLMNPKTGGVFASFGAHPNFEVALERSLTELLQGRSFEGLNDVPKPTFNSMAVTEPENFVDHFIDSTGVVSWRFFSNKADYEFCEWDFSGTNEEENAVLMAILKDLGKEVYIAEFNQLGATACRMLVPDYSEVYPVEDLIWDNTNKSLEYREDILNLHILSEEQLVALVERLEDSQQDNYIDIKTLIGIEFDENTVWGQLTILELKILIYLALGALEEAIELVGEFLQYNDNTVERGLFYQAVHAVLEVTLDEEMELEDYIGNFNRMFGEETMEHVVGSVFGEVRFYGLTPTSMKLEGLDKHLRLIESYKKLHQARKIAAEK
jgi:ribosomal protein S12 methylthiotransferase accessory factor YcaO/uncharacterized OsmC-like protein